MNWQLINIVGSIVIFLLASIGAAIVVFVALIVITMLYDKRRERAQPQEPITQVRVTVPRRQEIPQAFYDAFK